MYPVSRLAMAVALAISGLSMLAHNLTELPLSVTDPENAGPLLVAAGLAVAYAVRPESPLVAAAAFTWGVLNLIIGGIVSVLPLAVLPFAPEQSLTHYGAHLVYSLGQVPLIAASYRAARWAVAARKRSTPGSAP